jgi:type II secretory pathway component PulC
MAMKIYFLRSINILNLLLIAIVAAVAYFTFIPFFYLDARTLLPEVKEAPAVAVEEPAPSQGPSAADYAVISNQNLFHPERRIPPEIKPEAVIPKPEVVLYGTLITDDTSIAYVEDKRAPYSTPGRGKRQIALKKGNSLSGYILKEIEPNRIVLAKGDDVIVVYLQAGEKRQPGSGAEATPTSPAGRTAAFPPATPSTQKPALASPPGARPPAVAPETPGAQPVYPRIVPRGRF